MMCRALVLVTMLGLVFGGECGFLTLADHVRNDACLNACVRIRVGW